MKAISIFFYAACRGPFSNIGSVRKHFHPAKSPLATPQSLCKPEIINKGYNRDQDENIAESSFTELVSGLEYYIRLEEKIELLTDGNKTVVGLEYYCNKCISVLKMNLLLYRNRILPSRLTEKRRLA